MRKFLYRSLFFLALFGSLFVGTLIAVHYAACRPQTFLVDSTKHIMIMGNSWTANGIDDKVLAGSVNYSNSAEHYMFSYLKLKQFLKYDNNIDTLLLAFTQRNVDGNDSDWLYDKASATQFVSRFHPIMGFDEFMFYLRERPSVLGNLKIRLVLGGLVSNISYLSWIVTLNMTGTDHHLQKSIDEFDPSELAEKPTFDNHSYQIKYFNLIRELCRKNEIALIMVTTPIYKPDTYSNPALFEAHYKTYYSDVPLIDCRRLALPDSCYRDLTHLNTHGSKLFSEYLNKTRFHISK